MDTKNTYISRTPSVPLFVHPLKKAIDNNYQEKVSFYKEGLYL